LADEVDIANDYAERMREAALQSIIRDIPKGAPGECDECGNETARIVNGLCARCREELGEA